MHFPKTAYETLWLLFLFFFITLLGVLFFPFFVLSLGLLTTPATVCSVLICHLGGSGQIQGSAAVAFPLSPCPRFRFSIVISAHQYKAPTPKHWIGQWRGHEKGTIHRTMYQSSKISLTGVVRSRPEGSNQRTRPDPEKTNHTSRTEITGTIINSLDTRTQRRWES